MTNRPNGTLYIGVTGNLVRRVFEHREGLLPGFTRKYNLKRLVWCEVHQDIRSAIQREKTMKHWPKRWKINVIEAMNPEWCDLWEGLGP